MTEREKETHTQQEGGWGGRRWEGGREKEKEKEKDRARKREIEKESECEFVCVFERMCVYVCV